jgi:rubrerythrin
MPTRTNNLRANFESKVLKMTDLASLRSQLSILHAAVAIEVFGVKFYQRLEGCVAEENGKALMRSLARDEMKHKEMIEREIVRLSSGHDVKNVEADRHYTDIVPEKVFESFPTDRCLTVKEEIAAIEVGIDIERRSIKMYQEAAGNTSDPEIKRELEYLTRVEQGHLSLLKENLQMLKDGGAWYGYSPILEG